MCKVQSARNSNLEKESWKSSIDSLAHLSLSWHSWKLWSSMMIMIQHHDHWSWWTGIEIQFNTLPDKWETHPLFRTAMAFVSKIARRGLATSPAVNAVIKEVLLLMLLLLKIWELGIPRWWWLEAVWWELVSPRSQLRRVTRSHWSTSASRWT